MTRAARTLLLGFDACAPDLVREFAAAGHLPHLERLMATAATAPISHEPGYFVGSVWPTMMTGVPVTEHLWYTGTRFRPEHYDYDLQYIEHPPLWQWCTAAGGTVAVLDVPHFPVVEGLRGVHLVEWGCHDRFFGTSSWPPGFVTEVDSTYGTHPVGTWSGHPDPRAAPCDHVHREGPVRTDDELASFYADLVTGLRRKTEMSADLLARGGWDLFVSVFGEAHCAGHQVWHLHDRSDPDHDAALARRLAPETGDPLLDVYRLLDDAVGRHLALLDTDASVYVLLSHGMRGYANGTHLLPTMLHRLDQAYRHEPRVGRGRRTTQLDGLLDRLPPRARASALRLGRPVAARRYRAAESSPTEQLPPANERSWFMLDNNTAWGAVRLNLEGRERTGRIAASELDATLGWLEAALLELVDVDTGRPAVASVHRSATTHGHHPTDHLLADLLFEWNPSADLSNLWSPRIGRLTVRRDKLRHGDHDGRGVLLATGPGLRPLTVRIDPKDLAPTVLASLAVATPALPGTPVAALVPTCRSAPGRTAVSADSTVERAAPDHDPRVAAELVSTTAWFAQLPSPPSAPLVSVIVPTRNRRVLTMRAIDSVLRQTYRNVEVVVCDDASTDDTWDHLATVEDPRLVAVRHDVQAGAPAARNTALAVARGELVVHLDSDNTFDAGWVHAVACAFDLRPSLQWLYGARIIDDAERHFGRPAGGLPFLQLLPWDAEVFAERCTIDMNVLAHRATDLRFDPSLHVFDDWQFMLQLLRRHGDPLRLPVVATYYTTDAPDRQSAVPWDDKVALYDRIRREWDAGS
jgi:predicted AlkP superfamily phosphohydrolase/phosphomutase